MGRARRPHLKHDTPPPAPVEVRKVRLVVTDLTPRMRRLALAMAGGDAARVHVHDSGSFHVLDPEFVPDGQGVWP